MPSCCSCLKNFFKSLDLFPTSTFLRYKGDSDYTTATGGFISIAVITIFIVLFFSMGLKTVKRQIITATTDNEYQTDPSTLTFSVGPGNDMMFAIYVENVDLNASPRLFDVQLIQQFYSSGYVLLNTTNISLVPCTPQHFNYSQQILEKISQFTLTEALCPNVGQKLTVKGKYTSNIFGQLKININRCSTLDPTCASDAEFISNLSTKGYFELNVPFVNTNINPGKQQYRSYYVEDINAIYFDDVLGTYSTVFIQEDTISTDVSIMPWEQLQPENVTRITEKFVNTRFLTGGGPNLVQITILKSPKSQTFGRKFNKIDTYFSYVGGLVGTIIGLFFIMGPYTEKAYEISLAKKVLRDNENQELSSRSFHLGAYFLTVIKQWLSLVNINPDWPKTQKYIDFYSELQMQIDVTYILRKLMFLDAAVKSLMEDYEVEAICTRPKPTLDEAIKQRKIHFAPELLELYEEKKGQNDSNKGEKLEEVKNISSQNIAFEEIEHEQHKRYMKQDKQKQQDLSALEFSDISQEVQHVKRSVKQVERDRIKGKKISQKIVKQMNPSTIKIDHSNNQFGQSKAELLHIENISEGQKQDEKKYKKGDGFDYNFQK